MKTENAPQGERRSWKIKQTQSAKTVSLQLTLTAQEVKWGRTESLGELIERAQRVIDPSNSAREDFHPITSAQWLVRRATEAVCREIIRTGALSAPLSVRFVSRQEAAFDEATEKQADKIEAAAASSVVAFPGCEGFAHPDDPVEA